MDISSYFMPPEIRNAKKALCIQPHPDDIEIGMGGAVAALAAEGCSITYLTVTNGDLGDSTGKLDFSEIAALRRKETIAAGKVLGVSDFLFYDLPDGSLSDNRPGVLHPRLPSPEKGGRHAHPHWKSGSNDTARRNDDAHPEETSINEKKVRVSRRGTFFLAGNHPLQNEV